MYRIDVLPHGKSLQAEAGENLLQLLRASGFAPDAPCGGNGRCGKCTVLIDGAEVLACRTVINRDMAVYLPEKKEKQILTHGIDHTAAGASSSCGCLLAVDIGTTTVAAFLLDGATGAQLACESMENPQTAFGADVVSRVQFAAKEGTAALTEGIRQCLQTLILRLCQKGKAAPANIERVCVAGNHAMLQLFLGMDVKNLTQPPYLSCMTKGTTVDAAPYLPFLTGAQLQLLPALSGFLGADILAGALAVSLDAAREPTLLVDIGTNGEMILSDGEQLVACATAAGPALEGAHISCGMRGQTGAIDHVWLEDGRFCVSVIGGGAPAGICGSGLIDAVAAGLEVGHINKRGRVLTEDHCLHIAQGICLTQEDIRQVQLAKGAIAAGIRLLAAQLGYSLPQIRRVCLAGAFGTYMDPIEAVGNTAGSGAKMLVQEPALLESLQRLTERTIHLNLAQHPEFTRTFARNMDFKEGTADAPMDQ